ncbi:hypothetical protein ABE096_02515 [Robertmurraya massiliosenegalensis]|uniref:hypothetical protein n=1 Tax=Robertmurraya TaxID=2837507 RepID=UPI0039A6AB4F
MDDKRKTIIINEILTWKENRMLPEHYCDYLLALYTEGNSPEPEHSKSKGTKKKLQKSYILPLLLIPIYVFFFYFTELSFDLQMTLGIVLIIIAILTTYYFFRKRIQYQIALVISGLFLLLTSTEIASHFMGDNIFILYFVLILNCLLWILTGKKLKLLYFMISGYLGVVLLIMSIFIQIL